MADTATRPSHPMHQEPGQAISSHEFPPIFDLLDRPAATVPVPPFMDAKVIVSAYKELPRRRRPVPISRVAPTAAATRAKAGGGGGYSRRSLLLAYAQQLRRRRRGGHQQQRGSPPLLEWGEWKAGRVAGGDVAVTRAGRSWCSRLRSCARLWIRTFLRGARRIREGASCKK